MWKSSTTRYEKKRSGAVGASSEICSGIPAKLVWTLLWDRGNERCGHRLASQAAFVQ